MNCRLGIVILAVADLQRAAAFYREAFGWPATVEAPVYVEFALPNGVGLGVYLREGFARNVGQTPQLPSAGTVSGCEIYLFCDDLPATVAGVEAAGGRLLSPAAARPWGHTVAYFADPDGNVLALAQTPQTPESCAEIVRPRAA